MTVPGWISAIVRGFGSGAGLENLSFNERGVAGVAFENGFTLRFEYVESALMVEMSVPSNPDAERMKALLSYSHPRAAAPGAMRMRTGYITKSGRVVFAVRLESRDVTGPAVHDAFAMLWRAAGEFGGESWA
ncbi:MAG: hypothetical protein J6W80_05000 [Kiritimatiellae bacterium]|nr:hypothetical protein [Kiritimatiellia bacterium]